MALKTIHPVARPITVPVQCEIAMGVQKRLGADLKKFRYQVLEVVEALSTAVQAESKEMVALVHPWIAKVVSARHLALIRELNFVMLLPDPLILLDLVFGLPMMGGGTTLAYFGTETDS